MRLLIFAHRGEAQIFLKEMELKSHALLKELYIGKNICALITGEGHDNVLSKASYALAILKSEGHSLTKVINLGIAGSLEFKYDLHQIYEVRTVYREDEFKSFTLNTKNEKRALDNITVSKRILDKEDTRKLSHMATLVDRELWALAFVCKDHGVDLCAYKLISDHINEAQFCERIKEQAEFYSDSLYQHYINNSYSSKNNLKETPIINDSRFYFTVSQQRELRNLTNQIEHKESITRTDLIESLNLTKYHQRDITGKQRSSLLLQDLKARLYPFKTSVQDSLREINSDYEKYGAKFKYDPNLENCSFNFSCSIDSEEKLIMMSRLLSKYPWERFSKIMNGDFNV